MTKFSWTLGIIKGGFLMSSNATGLTSNKYVSLLFIIFRRGGELNIYFFSMLRRMEYKKNNGHIQCYIWCYSLEIDF